MRNIRERKIVLIGIVLGLLGGLLYWNLFGCSSYMTSSSPFLTSIWGAIAGGIIFDALQKERNINSTK